MAANKLHELIKKKNGKWQSLNQLRQFIIHNSKDKIKSFDGINLTTNKHRYGLAFGIVTWQKL